MKVAFLTEMMFEDKIHADNPNMRTEFAWMHALDADHYALPYFIKIENYDHVFVIFPKGKTFLSAEGSRLVNQPNPVSYALTIGLIEKLKQTNKKVHYVQEGPHWWFNDYEVPDQINFYNMVSNCDSIFAHNESDVLYYKGLFPGKPINTIPTLMIEHSIKDVVPTKEDKVIIGGNFARWYGGFESFITARNFELPIWSQTSHATREGEEQLVNHLPRVQWVDWIRELSTFKYAVHLMPTVAAGTFSLNCAYLGIPCIGNKAVDTQRICHPALSVDVDDLESARKMALNLKTDKEFYRDCNKYAKANYRKYYSLEVWKENMNVILNEKC
jgi:hypothetical protein